MRIQGCTAIITGASSGIGAATARALVQKGARVTLAARSTDALEQLRNELGTENTLAISTDVVSEESVRAMAARTREQFGRIDILVNNAGVGINGAVAELPTDILMKGFATNVLGPIHGIRSVVPHMRNVGGGVIADVSSMVTRMALPSAGAYRATKLALDALSDAARLELRRDNIRIITVYPGLTKTNFYDNALSAHERRTSRPPRTRRGRSPEFVARRIVWGIENEPRVVYMDIRGHAATALGALAPQLLAWMVMRRRRGGH